MKTLNFLFSVIINYLVISSLVYSQSDSVNTYYQNDITIEYSSGLIKSISLESGYSVYIPESRSLEGINKVKFLSDSIIKVSGKETSDVLVNIYKIEKITVSRGVSPGKIFGGAAIGALFGAGAGALINGLNDDNKESGGPYIAPDFEGWDTALTGLIIGALTGGIIGSLIPSYETYTMNKLNNEKRKELEKILMQTKNF